jgi:hypothetical protein
MGTHIKFIERVFSMWYMFGMGIGAILVKVMFTVAGL